MNDWQLLIRKGRCFFLYSAKKRARAINAVNALACSGAQPLKNKAGDLVLAANGEIYNHMELRKEFVGKYEFLTGSDCEVCIPLYEK